MTTILDLLPGPTITRADLAQAFKCGTFQGIEPADAAGKVFVFSDPSAGEEYGYTFDGQAEDDEFGPLYLYTGAGANGNQQPTGRNRSLLGHVEDGREVHLFVADGKVNGSSGAMRQRYIGEMVVDPVLPYEVRRGPGRDGKMRDVLVFRLRPAPGSEPAWTPKDRLKPATKDNVIHVEPEPVVVIPQQTSVKDKNSQQHTVSETSAQVEGGPRKVVLREALLVEDFKAHLESVGHKHKTFQINVAGESGALTPDLYDITDHVLYEAKGLTTRSNVRMAVGQLADYRRHVPQPDGLRVAILLPSEPSEDLKALLAELKVALVYQTDDGFEGFPLSI
ncbi:hypothetical protein [Streptomyces sp. NPDC056401]|uniref:hypothetical protein n=1 Tax=Streptomyces sp. NPDC056401 TaxID=3345809 RepID=UPI0035D5874B